MDMRDHHNIPFALPLVVGSFLGFIIGLTILKFIGNEDKLRNEVSNRYSMNSNTSGAKCILILNAGARCIICFKAVLLKR